MQIPRTSSEYHKIDIDQNAALHHIKISPPYETRAACLRYLFVSRAAHLR